MKIPRKGAPVSSGKAAASKHAILHRSNRGKKSRLCLPKRAGASSVMSQFRVSEDHGPRKKPRRYFDGPSTSAQDSPPAGGMSRPSTSASDISMTSARLSLPPLVIDSPRRADESFYTLEDEESDVSDSSEEAGETTSATPPPRLRRLKRAVKLDKRKRAKSPSTDDESESDNDLPKLFSIRLWGLIVAVVRHPGTITFSGLALVDVIYGSIKILGHVLEEEQEDYRILPVFSSNRLLELDVKTVRPGSACSQVSRLQALKKTLEVKFKIPEKVAKKILNACTDDSVIMTFRKDFRSSGLRFVAGLMPEALLSTKMKSEFGQAIFEDMGFTLNVGDPVSDYLEYPQCQTCVEDVLSSIKDSVKKNAPPPRVLVQGKRGSGKSTFLRYLINRVLNHYKAVLYLDGDPGQSEFTPPGCLSLVRVAEPFMGPPCAHPTDPEKMYFIGTANVQNAVDKYTTCVRLLADFYHKERSNVPLFVNTMGWVTGEGLMLLDHLKSCVSPTHIVNIVDESAALAGHRSGRARAPVVHNATSPKEYTFVRFAPASESRFSTSPADRRSLSMLAYLGKCQRRYMEPIPLNAVPSFGIHWKHVALHCGSVRSRNLGEHTLYAFNGSWVALLSVDESLMMVCEDASEFPKILSQDPDTSECHGFGMIRATDITEKLFYVITPVPYKGLAKVNTLVKGEMQAPYVIYTSQVAKGQIPYVTRVIGKGSLTSKNIKPRKFRQRATSG